VRGLNRLERVGETLRAALNEVAVTAPAWLQALAEFAIECRVLRSFVCTRWD
jgi:hypothetical protein